MIHWRLVQPSTSELDMCRRKRLGEEHGNKLNLRNNNVNIWIWRVMSSIMVMLKLLLQSSSLPLEWSLLTKSDKLTTKVDMRSLHNNCLYRLKFCTCGQVVQPFNLAFILKLHFKWAERLMFNKMQYCWFNKTTLICHLKETYFWYIERPNYTQYIEW